MSPHRSFTIPVIPEVEGTTPPEPITFDLVGQSFTCLPDPPLRANLDLIRASQEMQRSPQDQQGALNALAWDNYLLSVLVPSDRDRFRDLTSQPNFKLAHIAVMAEIFAWLQEVFTQRPFAQPPGSSNGQLSTGPTSPDAVPSEGSTPAG